MSRIPPEVNDLVRALRASESGARPREDCPEPERLWAAARGEAPQAEARELVQHTVECGACSEAWRLALGLAPVVSVARQQSSRRWIGLATAGLAAAALVTFIVLRPSVDTTPYRDEASPHEIRSLVPEDRPLPRQDCVLRWTPGPEGSLYQVEIAGDDFTVLGTARDIAATEYRVPETILGKLPPGARIRWRVTAVLPDGTQRASITNLAWIE